MVRYTGINHPAMVTADMDMTIRFWRDLPGMRLVAGLGRPGYGHYFFEISANDMIAFIGKACRGRGARPCFGLETVNKACMFLGGFRLRKVRFQDTMTLSGSNGTRIYEIDTARSGEY